MSICSPGFRVNLKDISVSMHPDNAVALRRGKVVDKETGTSHQHVTDALDPVERVLHVSGGRQELVFAHLNAFTMAEMKSNTCPAPSR